MIEVHGQGPEYVNVSGFAELEERASKVTEEVRAAEAAAGRQAGSVKIVSAAKYALTEELVFLRDRCGIADFGENRAQTLREHLAGLPDGGEGFGVHFIGGIQKNKLKYIVGNVCLIHSLDSEAAAAEIDRLAGGRGIDRVRVLVEINSGREPGKSGVMPEDAADFCLALRRFGHIGMSGFMTMGPQGLDGDAYFDLFSETCKLALDIWTETLHNIDEPILSMGMSDSFAAAIAAGSNCVRIGRSLFGRSTPGAK